MSEEPYEPIDCSLYDYLEIACLHRYQVLVQLRDRSTVEGLAITTKTAAGSEYLVLQVASADLVEVRLDQISELRVLSDPRTFDSVSFG